jgi:superfamily II DNA/RNA helicase
MTFDAKTAGYLSVSLEDLGRPVYSLESELRLDERDRVANDFVQHGGILLAPDDVLADLDLVEADAVVHYDLPMRTGFMQRRRATVLPREGHTLPVYALYDTTRAVDGEDALLHQYGFGGER